jgi:hypothetical protein
LPWPEKRREKLSSLGVDEGLRSRGRAVLWLAAAETRRASLFFSREERKKTHLWIGRGDDAHQRGAAEKTRRALDVFFPF